MNSNSNTTNIATGRTLILSDSIVDSRFLMASDLEAAAVQVLGAATVTTRSQGGGDDTLLADPSATPAAPHQAGG